MQAQPKIPPNPHSFLSQQSRREGILDQTQLLIMLRDADVWVSISVSRVEILEHSATSHSGGREDGPKSKQHIRHVAGSTAAAVGRATASWQCDAQTFVLLPPSPVAVCRGCETKLEKWNGEENLLCILWCHRLTADDAGCWKSSSSITLKTRMFPNLTGNSSIRLRSRLKRFVASSKYCSCYCLCAFCSPSRSPCSQTNNYSDRFRRCSSRQLDPAEESISSHDASSRLCKVADHESIRF